MRKDNAQKKPKGLYNSIPSKKFLIEIDQSMIGSTFRTILTAVDINHAQSLAQLMFQTQTVTVVMEVK